MKNKPNFIIVGAAKSGTTSLYSHLKSNPNIFLPDFKEPHYFANAHPLNFDVLNTKEAYYRLFQNQGETAIGEASTAYLYFSDVPDRIYSELPNCKIIALIRNPTDRALSMWGHQRREGLEERTLEQAIEQEIAGNLEIKDGVEFGFNYCKQGLVADNIEKYQAIFGKNNVFVADYLQLREEPAALVEQVCKFLDVEPHDIDTKSKRLNASGNPKSNWFHNLLNSKHTARRALVWPLKLILPAHARHQLWGRLRNWNILRGDRHQMKRSTKAMLDQFFELEKKRIDALIKESKNRFQA